MTHRPFPKPAEAVHIFEQDAGRVGWSLCGVLAFRLKGGRVASDTTPPVVTDEVGSANAVTCRMCLRVWRRKLASG